MHRKRMPNASQREVQRTPQGAERGADLRPPALQEVRWQADDLPAAPALGREASGPVVAAAPEIKTHILKAYPGPFRAVKRGRKRFEFRLDDRGFREGHRLRLREWNPEDRKYTGDELLLEILQLSRGPDWNIPRGYVIMSVAPIMVEAEVKGNVTESRRRRDGLGTAAL